MKNSTKIKNVLRLSGNHKKFKVNIPPNNLTIFDYYQKWLITPLAKYSLNTQRVITLSGDIHMYILLHSL